MASTLNRFESIARRAYRHTDATRELERTEHPFERRNIHADLPGSVRDLFDDGHYPQATFEAMKFVDEEVQRISRSSDYGKSLMMKVFGTSTPGIRVNPGRSKSDKSEQEGFMFLFAGATLAIRNPRGHKSGMKDDPDTCLDHLSFASLLLRRLDDAGVRQPVP